MGEHDSGTLTQAAERRQQHGAFEVLGLVDYHEGVAQCPAAYVGERQHFDQLSPDDFLDRVVRGDRVESVVHSIGPRPHLLFFRTGQKAEVLAADGVERAEDHDAALGLFLHHRIESCR